MVALPNLSFEPKTTRGTKSGGALPKLRILCPKTTFFGPKWPQNPVKTAKRRQTVTTLHVRLDCRANKSPILPSSSTICPKNGPKMAKNGQMCVICVQHGQNQKIAVSWATWLKTKFRGHQFHPQPPTFCGCQASESPNETPTPPYKWSLRVAGGQHSPRTVGANGGSTGVPGAEKIIFFKVVLRPLGMLKQAFLGRFDPMVARYGPWKIPKCLENGPFQDQKWVKNGSKMRFSKSDPRPYGMLKQVF